jgi:zinc D-Ala-D-Ala carboxypeptidase
MELKITENFTFNELTATSRGDAIQEANRREALSYLQNLARLAKELQKVRDFFRVPVIVTSGYRCPELNKLVGGAANSLHTKGVAADFLPPAAVVKGVKGAEFVFEWCRRHLTFVELILEVPSGRPPWIHLAVAQVGDEDSPGARSPKVLRWDGTKYEAVA